MDSGLDLGKDAAGQQTASPALLFPSQRQPSSPPVLPTDPHPESSIQYPASRTEHPASSIEPPPSIIPHPSSAEPPTDITTHVLTEFTELADQSLDPRPSTLDPRQSLAPARVDPSQQLLFPSTPQALCAELDLNWWVALKLHEDGWLSFAPQSTPTLNQAQEAELRFIASLVLAGCDAPMLAHLLSGLARPYAYDPQRLYFDWQQRSWRLVPTYQANPDAAFADWLDRLVASKEIATLAGIAELARDALARVRAVKNQQQLYHEHRHVTRDGEQMQG